MPALGDGQRRDTGADGAAGVPSLNDRANDLWERLLAIADRAGGAWSERARTAALALSGGGAAGDDTQGVELLVDINRAFDASGLAEIPTKALIAALCADTVDRGRLTLRAKGSPTGGSRTS